MDQARAETRERLAKIEQLNQIVHEVDDITADGKVTNEEILMLRQKLKLLEDQSRQK
jgi:hypothetical protein